MKTKKNNQQYKTTICNFILHMSSSFFKLDAKRCLLTLKSTGWVAHVGLANARA